MTLLEFVASVISSLAWPTAVLVGILTFRRNIGRRIEEIRRLTWGDKSVDFGEKLEKIENQAATLIPSQDHKKLPAPREEPSTVDKQDVARFESVLEVEPRLAIIDAWASVEREMQRVALERGYGPQAKSGTFLVRRLSADGVLGRETVKIVDGLRMLRNAVAHGEDRQITIEEARRYHELAGLIIEKLRETVEI